MRNAIFFGLLLGRMVFPCRAQSLTEMRAAPTSSSVYARQAINLLPGFETTAAGWEARLTRPTNEVGQWSAPFGWTPYARPEGGTGIVGIHTHVLPNGNVFSWEGHNATSVMTMSPAYQWNPSTGTFTSFENSDSNIFCSGHNLMPDGKLLVAGGHHSYGTVFPSPDPLQPPTKVQEGYIGIADANIFDFSTGTWQTPASSHAVPLMAERRWYPTNTSLANGESLAIAGQIHGGNLPAPNAKANPTTQNLIPEVWQTGGGWRRLTGAARRLPLYPMMFGAPDGRVFNAGPNSNTGYLSTTGAGAWQDVGRHQLAHPQAVDLHQYDLGEHEAGTAVMYAPGKILIAGGGGFGGVTRTTELIDLNSASPQFRFGPNMAFGRQHVNATLLPDGTVLVTGGVSAATTVDADAVLSAEIWTPPTATAPDGSWRTVAAMKVPRLYHSTAVLLPDGRVLSAGGGEGGGFTAHYDAEIYSPPYLFNGPRPSVGGVPPAVGYGQSFILPTPDYARITRVTWVRLSSVTHSFNMNQRFAESSFTQTTNGLTVTAPPDANACPPGHYLLFLLDGNGIPSVGNIVKIGPSNCAAAVALSTAPRNSNNCAAMMRVSAAGTNLGTDYRWTIDGYYQPSYDGRTSIEVYLGTEAPSATVAVAVTSSCGGSAATSTQRVTHYFPKCDLK
ncbi:DUF1929 domain-containing protein [Hymenobacter aquaticus]|uniref:DUF1929 domain-containing protein n=1 Tax=Hymenobacter aquaticus TaxID=1867101 RepID=A0A4Z0PVN5_9BACT|nr:galactose oxidase early set domain-containing protein [Hymenobacter aquaticus]TGE21787.1 DUF1929 domain-containing protein [Hymenobacter aquaticus]